VRSTKRRLNLLCPCGILARDLGDGGDHRAGLVPPISAIEIRQMLADNVEDYFKQEFLEFDVSDEEELTDTEREDKALTRIVAMAEKNYHDGKITLDELIEFRLGTVLDERISTA